MSDVAVTSELGAPPVEKARRTHPLMRFVVRRLAVGVLTLLVASIVIFLGTNVVPGSPASAVLGRQASPQVVAQVNRRIGYDKPVDVRYERWLGNILQGNLGVSAVAEVEGNGATAIWPIIRGPFANTTTLALCTVVFLIPLSLLFGLVAGLNAGRWPDHLISTLTMVFMALPEFVVGSLLIVVFSITIGLFPPVSLLPPGEAAIAHPDILVLPVLTLLAVSVAWTIRLVRVGTIEVAETDYVQTARLQGVSERTVLRRYVLRNALAPSVQIFALSIQYLFGGVIVTELVFAYPGLGRQLVNAVLGHDNTQVQAIAMILATIYILINIVADLLIVVLVPKLRTQS
jgi:peptide/nickel transport system permease protein